MYVFMLSKNGLRYRRFHLIWNSETSLNSCHGFGQRRIATGRSVYRTSNTHNGPFYKNFQCKYASDWMRKICQLKTNVRLIKTSQFIYIVTQLNGFFLSDSLTLRCLRKKLSNNKAIWTSPFNLFLSSVLFLNPLKTSETKGFLKFSGGVEMILCAEMG